MIKNMAADAAREELLRLASETKELLRSLQLEGTTCYVPEQRLRDAATDDTKNWGLAAIVRSIFGTVDDSGSQQTPHTQCAGFEGTLSDADELPAVRQAHDLTRKLDALLTQAHAALREAMETLATDSTAASSCDAELGKLASTTQLSDDMRDITRALVRASALGGGGGDDGTRLCVIHHTSRDVCERRRGQLSAAVASSVVQRISKHLERLLEHVQQASRALETITQRAVAQSSTTTVATKSYICAIAKCILALHRTQDAEGALRDGCARVRAFVRDIIHEELPPKLAAARRQLASAHQATLALRQQMTEIEEKLQKVRNENEKLYVNDMRHKKTLQDFDKLRKEYSAFAAQVSEMADVGGKQEEELKASRASNAELIKERAALEAELKALRHQPRTRTEKEVEKNTEARIKDIQRRADGRIRRTRDEMVKIMEENGRLKLENARLRS